MSKSKSHKIFRTICTNFQKDCRLDSCNEFHDQVSSVFDGFDIEMFVHLCIVTPIFAWRWSRSGDADKNPYLSIQPNVGINAAVEKKEERELAAVIVESFIEGNFQCS